MNTLIDALNDWRGLWLTCTLAAACWMLAKEVRAQILENAGRRRHELDRTRR
jgi:hypothetical protein